MLTIGRLPFAVAVLLVAGLTLLVLVAGAIAGLGARIPFLLAIPVAVAVWFLLEYRTLPLAEPSVPLEAPFDDPVEAADRPPAPPSGETSSPPEEAPIPAEAKPPEEELE